MRLEELTASLVNTAIGLYLQVAYGDAVSRDKHARAFPPDMPVADVLGEFVSENAPSVPVWSLRLGSAQYPHMKLQIRGTSLPGEYVFGVDRHDCFSFDDCGAPDLDAWRELQANNHALKKAIESLWAAHGVPTERDLRARAAAPGAGATGNPGRETLLVVDNDPDATELIALQLRGAGYDVRTAAGMGEALAALKGPAAGVAGVLTDLLLEDGSGCELVAAIRADAGTADLPVALMTGMSNAPVKFRQAFDAFLRKPCSADELTAAVRSMLEGRD